MAAQGTAFAARTTSQPPDSGEAGSEAHAALADALRFAQGWSDQAALHYRNCLKYRPDDADAWARSGLALLADGQTGEGMSAVEAAVRLDPRKVRGRRLMARGLIESGNPREAGSHAAAAVALAPGDADAHDLLGVTLAMQGRFDQAALNFTRAVEIDPGHTDAADHLRRIQSRWHVVIGVPVLQELKFIRRAVFKSSLDRIPPHGLRRLQCPSGELSMLRTVLAGRLEPMARPWMVVLADARVLVESYARAPGESDPAVKTLRRVGRGDPRPRRRVTSKQE